LLQKEKVFAALNSSFDEIWWFYPSSDSETIDRYVVYNYVQKIWYYGTMARTAWLDRGILNNPIAAGADNYLYDHENGLDDGSTSPASAITSYIESSQLDISDGDGYVFIRRLIPDVTFDGSITSTPSASFTLKTRNFPGGSYGNSDASTVTQTAKASTTTVEQFTNQVHVRLRGRSFALRVGSDGAEVKWRLGSPRVDIRQDGRR